MALQQPRMMPSGETACPIPLETLGTLYKASDDEVRAMVTGIPDHARARLAAFCYGKSHLHQLGLKIGATCDELTILQVAGTAGSVLYAQSRMGLRAVDDGEARPAPTKAKISLATLRSMNP